MSKEDVFGDCHASTEKGGRSALKSLIKGNPDSLIIEMSTGLRLQQVAAEFPDRIALVEGGVSEERPRWTYRELLLEAEALARELLRSANPGDRLAICAPNRAEWVIFEYAAGLAGLVFFGISPAAPLHELRYYLEDSGAAVLVVVDEYRGNPLGAIADKLLVEISSLRLVVNLDKPRSAREQSSVRLPEVAPDAPAIIQYTSGTTGQPKGVVLTHRGVLTNSATAMEALGLGAPLVLLNSLPMHHVGGSENNTLGVLSVGGTNVIHPWDAGEAIRLMVEEHVTYWTAVPTMITAVLTHPQIGLVPGNQLELVTSGGTTVSANLLHEVEAALDCDFGIIFGQTECGGVVSMSRRDDDVEARSQTCGHPLSNTDVKIASPASGKAVMLGQIGEIWVRSPSVMDRYQGRPNETEAALPGCGWVRTGDLGTLDEDGLLRITGRLKDVIMRGGENVYPREIEDLLSSHPSISSVAVVGVPDARLGEEIAVFYVPVRGTEPDQSALIAYLEERVSRHKMPRHWHALDALPLTSSGKVRKFALRDGWIQSAANSNSASPTI